jgi:hypothetical protein
MDDPGGSSTLRLMSSTGHGDLALRTVLLGMRYLLMPLIKDICYISAPKNHFEGFRYANHTFNLLESLRRKDSGKLSKSGDVGQF